jgi:hypothetical protein
MKTIVKIETGLSIYLFDDNIDIQMFSDRIEIGNPMQFTISDCNSSNCIVYENVTTPTDYTGEKYFYKNNTWSENTNFIDPTIFRTAT